MKVMLSPVVSPIMMRRYLAEFIGTFAYVFFGCGARIMVGYGEDLAGRLLIYFTFGFTMLVMTYALGHISAAPFNPAITFGLAVVHRFPWLYVLPYWIAQIGGAIAATVLHLVLIPDRTIANRYGSTIPTIGIMQAFGIEIVITFFLMLVAMSTATDKRVNRASVGLAVGLTLAIGGFFAGPLTGGSMNPARSLAPALFYGGRALQTLWIYLLGPLLGSVLAALIYEVMRGESIYAISAPEDIFKGLEGSVKTKLESQDPVKRPL